MGVAFSMISVAESVIRPEVTVERFPDGLEIKTQRHHPVVATVIGLSALLVLAMTVDGGNGTITKTFGRRCIDCGLDLG